MFFLQVLVPLKQVSTHSKKKKSICLTCSSITTFLLNDEPLFCIAPDNEVDEVLYSTLLYSAVLSSVRTAPILTWKRQISLWQKRQNETWMSSARCGVFMRSGSRASQKRPRRTGSHSGRGLCIGLLLMDLNSLNSALFLSLSLLCFQLCVLHVLYVSIVSQE